MLKAKSVLISSRHQPGTGRVADATRIETVRSAVRDAHVLAVKAWLKNKFPKLDSLYSKGVVS